MASASDILTLVSSLALRVSAYIFLRWIPGTFVPALAVALTLVYVPSFFRSVQDTAQFKLISDELEVIVKETEGDADDASDVELLDGADEGPLRELDVQETLEYEEREPKVLRTLLTGMPSPSSLFWSWITFGINMALLCMVADHIYRAPWLHQCHHASFGRVGYVSDHSANILVREPYAYDVRVLYRSIDEAQTRSWMHKTLASSQPKYWLTGDTDFTGTVTIDHLRADTPYEYVIETSSGNITGTFSTPPKAGHISHYKGDKYTFVHSSCIKPRVPYTPWQHPLNFPGMDHLARWIPELKPYFMLFLGDFIYVDVPKRLGVDPETYRREYRQVYSSPSWPAVSKDLPWIHVIDDHEIQNDWSSNMTGVAVPAYDAFMHYHASVNPPAHRAGHTYFSFTQGPASFFLVDTRRYRSPATKDPNDVSKSMLGPTQLDDLVAWIRKPAPRGVHWKIIVTGVPFTKNWQFGSEDTWGGYLVERRQILEAAWEHSSTHGVGVVVLSGDRHEFAATSFPPPADSKWPVSATVHEFSTSPLSMFYLPFRTYGEIDDEDVCIKYLPDGNSKFGAVEITAPEHGEQSLLNYRLFIDGKEAWTHVISTPPLRDGSKKAHDAIWA